MKNYDELTDRLLQRRDRYIAQQKRKRKQMVRVASSAGCCVLVGAIGVGLMRGGGITHTPPVANGVPSTTAAVTTVPTDAPVTTTDTNAPTTAPTQPMVSTTAPTQTRPTAIQTQPTGTTVTTQTTVTTRPTQSSGTQNPTGTIGTQPTTHTTQPTQTTPTTQPTVTDPSGDDPVEPLPPWPCLWIYYENRKNYGNEEIPIYFKLEGFEEVDPNWVQQIWYTAEGFSVVGDITVERDVETGGLIYRMVLAHDGVTPKPSFFFSVITADGMKQTDGLYGYLADHGFFVSVSYDSAVSYSYYYLVETGVLTHDEYQKIMEKYWSESVNGSVSWS